MTAGAALRAGVSLTGLVVLTLVICPAQSLAQPDTSLLYSIESRLTREGRPTAAPGRARYRVKPTPRGRATLTAVQQRVRVPMPTGAVVTFEQEHAATLASGSRAWHGTAEEGAGRLVLVSHDDVVAALVEVGEQAWALTPDAVDGHVLEELGGAQLACPGGQVGLGQGSGEIREPYEAIQPWSVAAMPGASLLDLLVAYTSDARAGAGGEAAIRATIELAVEALNAVLVNSAVDARVRLVDAVEVTFAETGSMARDLEALTSGALGSVRARRDVVGADLVSLVVERNDQGFDGLAWLMQEPTLGFEALAYSVVLRRTMAPYTLAHEIGHNLGLSHDRASAVLPGAYPYAYGYRDPPYFRDVMSYACATVPCPLAPHYSNPEVLYKGRPTGRAQSEDNARALRQTIPLAATFREAQGLTVTSVMPERVPTLGGVRITIEGDLVGAVVEVSVGGQPATDLTRLHDGALSVVVPRHPEGRVPVRVTAGSGEQATLRDALQYVPSQADPDGDAMETDWEHAMGLNPHSSDGGDGPEGDPDGDGLSNLGERRAHGHPNGHHQRYLAEGAAGSFFSTQLALLNTASIATGAVIRYLNADGSVTSTWLRVPGLARRTLLPDAVAADATSTFSIVVESEHPLVAERTMTWGEEDYGAHAETAVATPARTWYLAEGTTVAGCHLFYLLQNPASQPATVLVTYLRNDAGPLHKTYVLAPQSRTNVWVNVEQFEGAHRALASAEVSAVVEVLEGPAIIVERAMYRDQPGQMFAAGHASAGVTEPTLQWFMAEGATGPFFDTFLLLANPQLRTAEVIIDYLLPDGTTLSRRHLVGPQRRYTVWVDHEAPELSNTAFSTVVRVVNGVAIVAERVMWWPGDASAWHEAHHAAGVTRPGPRWALAEGQVGGDADTDTYVLLANTGHREGRVRVVLYFEDGPEAVREFAVGPGRRLDIDVGHEFPEAPGRRFGVVVESASPDDLPLVVERSMYRRAAGQRWAAGTSVAGVPLP